MKTRLASLASGALVAAVFGTRPGPLRAPTLSVVPASRSVSIRRGQVAPNDSVRVTLSGDDRPLIWFASAQPGHVVLINETGQGTATLAWRRATRDYAAGVYVDTITVSMPNVLGSPAQVIDSVTIDSDTPGAPVQSFSEQQLPPLAGDEPALGRNPSMRGRRIFPASDPWNQPIDTAAVDPNSLAILTRVGLSTPIHPDFGALWNGGPFGFSYVVVPESQPRVPIRFQYAGESDPGPYPFPPHIPVEAGDGHVVVITQRSLMLFETFGTQGGPPWSAGSGAIFDLINGTSRPAGWTSADAAGLPIFPGLVRYDEVYEAHAILHAIRFTLTRTRHGYVPPATHWASDAFEPNLAPMGMRVRLKAGVDISHYPPPAQVILRALKRYGMILADNGGDFFFSGTADARWDDNVLNTLKAIKVADFEVVRMPPIIFK